MLRFTNLCDYSLETTAFHGNFYLPEICWEKDAKRNIFSNLVLFKEAIHYLSSSKANALPTRIRRLSAFHGLTFKNHDNSISLNAMCVCQKLAHSTKDFPVYVFLTPLLEWHSLDIKKKTSYIFNGMARMVERFIARCIYAHWVCLINIVL